MTTSAAAGQVNPDILKEQDGAAHSHDHDHDHEHEHDHGHDHDHRCPAAKPAAHCCVGPFRLTAALVVWCGRTEVSVTDGAPGALVQPQPW